MATARSIPRMLRHSPHARRLGGILLPLALLATLLSSGVISGQDAQDGPLVAEPEPVLASAKVTVLGDGFIAAPSVAPVRSGSCAASEVGPVERAALASPDTAVLVDNRSCPGASLTSIASEQLADIDSESALLVVGGVGLEFDWSGLSDACLDTEFRSASACLEEANLARATAANSFFSWRSVLQQAHRAAPDATIAVVAPPTPVGTTELTLGSVCCGQSTDAHTQIRGVFDTAGALRRAVAESLPEIPIIVVETDVLFDGHRIGDPEPWLGTAGQHIGLPNALGVGALADRLEPLIPVGAAPAEVVRTPAEYVLVVGTTADDAAVVDSLGEVAGDWFERLDFGDLNPSVAVVPIRTTTPPAEAEPPVEDTIPEEPVPENEADDEPPANSPLQVDEPETTTTTAAPETTTTTAAPETTTTTTAAPETTTIAAPETTTTTAAPETTTTTAAPETTTTTTAAPETTTTTTAAPETTTTTTAAPETTTTTTAAPETTTTTTAAPETTTTVPLPVPSFATSAAELRDDLATLPATDGVSAMADLRASLTVALDLFTPTIDNREVIVFANNLEVRELDEAEREQFAEIGAALPEAVSIVVNSATDAEALTEALVNTGISVAIAGPDELANLPAPRPLPELTTIETAATFEAVRGSSIPVTAAIDATRPAEASVTWGIGGVIVGVGQRTTIPTDGLADGTYEMLVTATTERNSITTTAIVTVSGDGDGLLDGDGCPDLFDVSDADIDGDGRPASCDTDDDGDGLPDTIDPCPTVRTDNLRDIDLDGLPDRCDGDFEDGPLADADADRVPNIVDNCPLITQTDQLDADNDGIGDDCEDQISVACTIFGTNGDDRIRGTSGPDVICALGGDDVVTSLDGEDIVFGGDGDDKLHGGADTDRLYGGRGNDEIYGNGSADVLIGGFGNDEIHGGFGPDVIFGDRGADELNGDDGADVIVGGRGNDDLRGGSGADTLAGGRGNDSVFGENGADLLDGGPGSDNIGGGRGNDTIVTVESIDTVRGGSQEDLIDAAPIRIT